MRIPLLANLQVERILIQTIIRFSEPTLVVKIQMDGTIHFWDTVVDTIIR